MALGTIMWCLLSSTVCVAQTAEDIARFRHIGAPQEIEKPSWRAAAQGNSNELETIFSWLFLAYKSWFSSQDGSQCSFHPSCSVYALEAIKKQGPLVGIINFFDRFSRCNGLSPEAYPVHPETHKLHDPVD